MLLLRRFGKLQPRQSFYFSSVKLDSTVNDALDNEIYKPKDHPGKVNLGCIELPDRITSAIKKTVKDFPIKQLITDGAALSRYIHSRQLPMEQDDVFRKKRKLQNEVLERMGYSKVSEIDSENVAKAKQHLRKEVDKLFYQRTYLWKPMLYDDYKSLSYAIGRSAKEYSTILRVFTEIAKRNPDFKPRSFFDFGAGVGTGTWAASELWKQSLYEYFLVDTSREMNNLSDLILRDGDENKHLTLKNVYHRQFLPASTDTKYDVILSAYALMELPDLKTRIETLLTLWNKCDGYLVLIEEGTNAGFSLINEARDFLMNHLKETDAGFVYAPCPHQEMCPRFMDAKDATPCNFPSSYNPLRIGEPQKMGMAYYSYLVLKKGSRSSEDASIEWPRVVRPTLVRSGHSICRMCTNRGKLEEKIISKGKHTKWTYRCVRKTDWGDRFPIQFEDEPEDHIGEDDNDSNQNHGKEERPEDTLVTSVPAH